LVKLFLNAGVQIRHINNLTPMNFVVDSRNFYAAIDKMEGGKLMEHLLISTETAYVNHYILSLRSYGRTVLMLQIE
jgi:hypothetical protein